MRTPMRDEPSPRANPLLRVPDRLQFGPPPAHPRPTRNTFAHDFDSTSSSDDEQHTPHVTVAVPAGSPQSGRGVVTPAASTQQPSGRSAANQLQNPTIGSAAAAVRSAAAAPMSSIASAAGAMSTGVTENAPTSPAAAAVAGDSEAVEDSKNRWTTNLFTDACSDVSLVCEVIWCHPCNISAQYEAALRKSPEPADPDSHTEHPSSSDSGSGGDHGKRTGLRHRRAGQRQQDSSSDSSTEDERELELEKLREALPPLNIVPCVSVIVLDVLCFGAGSLLFSYWLRNEITRRFNIVPDASEMMLKGVERAKELKSSAKKKMKDFKEEVKRENQSGTVSRDEETELPEADDDYANGDEAATEPDEEDAEGQENEFDAEQAFEAHRDEQQPKSMKDRFASGFNNLRNRMKPKMEAMKAGAKVIGRKAKATATKAAAASKKVVAEQAERAALRGADYAQQSLAAIVCCPCALCQSHRELERRGLPPTRYLGATRVVAAFATGSLSGNAKLARRMM